jgi:cation diffusion facilitator family transporter
MSEGRKQPSPQREGGHGNIAEVRKVSWVGLVSGLGLTAVKLAAGLLARSQALVADAVHSLSDTSTDVAILVGVRYWSAPADKDHPYGHQRIETLVTIFIGLLVGGVAVALAYNALNTLRGGKYTQPGWAAFGAAVVSIVVKEVLYRWTAKVGKRVKSSAVVANAWHHRSDALSSIPVALAVAGAAISPSWSFLDPLGAVLVSVFVLIAAWRILRPALGQMVDVGAPEHVVRELKRLAAETKGVKGVHALRTRYLGSGLQADLHVTVDGGLTVQEGHDISEDVKQRLVEHGPDVLDVVVHLEPHE